MGGDAASTIRNCTLNSLYGYIKILTDKNDILQKNESSNGIAQTSLGPPHRWRHFQKY